MKHVPPKGKHLFGTVRVGEKGQIVIPKKARDIFGIKPGDELMVLGDEEQGLALLKNEKFLHFVAEIMKRQEMPDGWTEEETNDSD
ncbi:MAG: AbrB/MazE/SpoVT family DNA-binding domain-containing protein [Clostridiaceae bacterium]|nr:AbrB/MazE/SpoVT family DNA-binding domain-containing protein [Clostridiaceae bacterium]